MRHRNGCTMASKPKTKKPELLVKLMLEEWRTVPGWDQYEVSNKGRLRRKGRKPSGEYHYKGRLITWIEPKLLTGYGPRGYVTLEQNGFKKRTTIAPLVLLAFVGPPPSHKHVSRHLDDRPNNNVLTNLRWGTRKQNRADSVRNGIQSAGSAWAKKVSAKLKGRPRAPEVWAKIRSTRAARGNYNWSGR